MMEKGAVSVSWGRRRGERMWMPEKAAGCNGEGVVDSGSGEWLVASGEWGTIWGAQPGVAVLLVRPESWS